MQRRRGDSSRVRLCFPLRVSVAGKRGRPHFSQRRCTRKPQTSLSPTTPSASLGLRRLQRRTSFHAGAKAQRLRCLQFLKSVEPVAPPSYPQPVEAAARPGAPPSITVLLSIIPISTGRTIRIIVPAARAWRGRRRFIQRWGRQRSAHRFLH